MTAIAAVSDGSDVWMGADAFPTDDSDDIHHCRQTKVWLFPPPRPSASALLVGNTGLHIFGHQVARYWHPPDWTKLDPLDMAWVMADSLWHHFRDDDQLWCRVHQGVGGGQYSSGDEGLWDARLLLGFRGRIFHVGTDGSVDEMAEDYTAIGSGERVLRGSLHTSGQLGRPPAERIELALSACEYHVATLRSPFTIISTRDAPV